MALMDFIKKQFIDVIHWTEDRDGVLAYRYLDAGLRNPECAQKDGARLADCRLRE